MGLYKLLPILMISKKKVINYKVNYEDYLIELLNASFEYFMEKTNGEKFVAIKEQSHGECDARTKNYEIDFKLLVPTEFMMVKNETLPDIDYNQINDGFIFVNDNEKSLNKDLQRKADILYQNFISKICFSNKETLLSIKDENNILTSSIKNMSVNKNILVFVPCIFNNQIYCVNLAKRLFNPLLSLRDNIAKETYITFLQDDYFQIIKYENGNYLLVDKIYKFVVPTFMELYRYTSFI